MRIVRFLFFAFLWILGLGAVIFFLGRELLLVWEINIIKSDYNSILDRNYSSICSEKFSYNQDSWNQLRFLSDDEYNVEVVCSDFSSSPVALENKKLLPFVKKVSSGSGFVASEGGLPSFIEIEALGRKAYIYTDDREIYSNYFTKPDLDYNQGPLSSCQSHNYQCCSLDTESGVGEQLKDVNDCPKSCYQSCSIRPAILLFNTRPSLDESRTVSASVGESISFSFVIGNGKSDAFSGQLDQEEKEPLLKQLQALLSKEEDPNLIGISLPVEVAIDFGDGETWQGESLQETIEHSYTCSNKTCYYQAKINAKDAQGVLSADDELSKMVIKVSR